MINLSDQTVGRRFVVGQIRYKLLDDLWIYGAKDIHRGIDISLLLFPLESKSENLDLFLDYLDRCGINLVESSHYSFSQKTYRYAAVDINDRRRLESLFNDWSSGKPAPNPLNNTPTSMVKTKEDQTDSSDLSEQKGTVKKETKWAKIKYLAIGAGSVLVLFTLMLCVASPYIIKVLTPTATPTLTSTPTSTLTSTPTPTFTLTPTTTFTPTFMPTPTFTETPTGLFPLTIFPTLIELPLLTTATPTLQILVVTMDTSVITLSTGEFMTIPANSQITILNPFHTACEVLADWNGIQVIIPAKAIFPDRTTCP